MKEKLYNQVQLRQHLEFSDALFAIAQCFVRAEFNDTIIDKALELLGNVSKAGRAYLFLFDKNGKTMDNTNEWCAPGVEPLIDKLKQLPTDMFPWWMDRLSNGEVICVTDVDSMDAMAGAESDILKTQDIKSILVLPVNFEGRLSGFIGLDNAASKGGWDKTTIEYLKIAGEMIGMSIERRQKENQIIQQKEELEDAHRKLQITQAQLVSSEKLAGIGQLAAGVAHEINNPIGYVMSNSESIIKYIERLQEMIALYDAGMSKDLIDKERKRLKIGFILEDLPTLLQENLEGLHKVGEIIKNLKSFSRIDSNLQMNETDINECVRSTLLIANNEIKYVAKVEVELGDIPTIYCNGGEINQVLLNIVVNAAQAVKSKQDYGEGLIRVRTACEENGIICEVTDNGPGIPNEFRSRIFEPFFTTKEVGKGTGLGLSIAYDIITNKHKGKIEFRSEVGVGTCFTIHLPEK